MDKAFFKLDHFWGELMHKLYLAWGDFATYLMKGISWLAEVGALFILIGIILCIFKKTRRLGGSILIALAIGVLVSNICLKLTIARNRPFTNIGSDFFKWWLDAGNVNETGYSFPSGHTTASTAFAIALFLNTPKKKSWPILFLPVLMLFSRTYLMVHYITDCLAGMIVGTVAGTIAYFVMKLIYGGKNKFCMFVKNFSFKDKSWENSEPITQPEINENHAEIPEEKVYVTQDEELNTTNVQDVNKDNATNNQDNLDNNKTDNKS